MVLLGLNLAKFDGQSMVGRQNLIWCCTCGEPHATDTLVSNVALRGDFAKGGTPRIKL